MSTAWVLVAIAILASLALGLVRVAVGGDPVNRMMAAQLLGSGGVGVLLALTAATDTPVLVDAALVFAALAAVSVVAFVHRIWRSGPPSDD
ncbi:monovalent cation/H+ antiporter complex subunit F [Arhodomonas sp. SL1]|uniref:monovalent cation/H+ antiporter complex subunit F n=1 Tax=Arhodomonas sp. SL1 TaxID=3425691 RepID=UPI003F8808E7